jgi:hypothetical protein
VLIPAGTINNWAATQTCDSGWHGGQRGQHQRQARLVGSVTVAQWADTTSFTLVVSNAGPSHADKQHQRHACQAKFTHDDRRGWLERGQRKREHGQLQRLTGSGTFAGSVTIASGGTVTVTIEVTAISVGQLHQHADGADSCGHHQQLGSDPDVRQWLARWSTWSTSAPSKAGGFERDSGPVG